MKPQVNHHATVLKRYRAVSSALISSSVSAWPSSSSGVMCYTVLSWLGPLADMHQHGGDDCPIRRISDVIGEFWPTLSVQDAAQGTADLKEARLSRHILDILPNVAGLLCVAAGCGHDCGEQRSPAHS